MKLSDLQERFGDRELHSLDSSEDNKIEFISLELAKSDFPTVKLSSSEHVAYFPFKLCHSIPRVNSRGRTFMPTVLQKSFASLMDQCLDYEHELVDNNTTKRDRIIGHVKAVKFDHPAAIAEIATALNSGKLSAASLIPVSPLPVVGLGVLYNRAEGVNEIVAETNKNPKSWRVSMECYHAWQDAYLWHDKKDLININDASDDMLDCIGMDCVKPYKGRELAVCIGGLDKEIAFLGAALTTNPADTDAEVLGFIAGVNRELSSQKTFFMPLREFRGMAKEVASAPFSVRDKLVEHAIKELASVVPLGETEPGGLDNHVHMVMSDGTIMPASGHMHSAKTISITAGNKASFSGITDPAHLRPSSYISSSQDDVHNHTWNIDLKKKVKVTTDKQSGQKNGQRVSMQVENYSAADFTQEEVAEATVTIGETEMKLQELMASLAKEMATVSAVEKPDEMKAAQARIAELASKMEKMNAEEEFKTRVEAEVKARVDAGQLIPKEKADEAVAAAQKEADKKLEIEKKRLEMVQERKNKCLQAGINLDFEFEGVTNADNKPMTVNDRLAVFTPDEAGEKDFNYNFAMWKKIAEQGAEAEKQTEDFKAKEAAKAADKAKEAASANGNGNVRHNTMHLAGGGPTGTQTEALRGFGSKPDQVGKHNGGVHLLLK